MTGLRLTTASGNIVATWRFYEKGSTSFDLRSGSLLFHKIAFTEQFKATEITEFYLERIYPNLTSVL